MNRLLFLSLSTTLWFSAQAQILQPAAWSVSSETLKGGKEVDLVFEADIDPEWYLYSSDFDCDPGPLKTTVELESSTDYQPVGDLKAIDPIAKHDDIFGCEVKIFKGHALFRQRVKLLRPSAQIQGTYSYQVCTLADGKCVNGDGEFSLSVGTGKAKVLPPPHQATPSPSTPDTTTSVAPTASQLHPAAAVHPPKNTGPHIDKSILSKGGALQEESFLSYLIFAFLLGLASLITPCVFPMIPMTVTFFLKGDSPRSIGIRNAIIFGLSIILIYTLAGTVFAYTLGAEGLNALATHWAPNLLVFVLFVAFALSFLGLFEITAPSALVNQADRQADRGGLAGVFFMAATLTLVSFSCTIPIVGNVIVLASGGQTLKPILAMFSYSLAFAIPFTLFAAFPEWLKRMPKSGGWLNSVKVSLGFLELALSLKFLSIVDQAYHWGILDREVNIILWVVIFTLLGLYFMGKIRLPHDTPLESITLPRLFLAMLTFSFALYLMPGLFGAPLKALAGYLPPKHTLDFDLSANGSTAQQSGAYCDPPKYASFLHLPHGLNGYFDYDQALACARQQGKPLFIDFTGHGCTNCREMEAVVWSEPEVLQRLREDYVIVALYVDDKTPLPETEWVRSKHDQQLKKTIGKKNADIQIANLENNAQPFYVLVGQDERVLAWPYGYDRDPAKFAQFLAEGKKKYKELYKRP